MKKLLTWTVAIVFCFILTLANSRADDATDALQGVWEAKSGEHEGKQGTPEELKFVRFTFKGEKISIRDHIDRPQIEVTYTVDAKKSPNQIDVTISDPAIKQKILGIYEIKGDELKMCFRNPENAAAGRPTEFATKGSSGLALIVFKRVPADKK